MEFPAESWVDLFDWLRAEAAKLRLPTSLRSGFPPNLDSETAEWLRKHVNHWLATDEWPAMEETDEAWAHVFLEYALHELMDAMRRGLPRPETKMQMKGVLQRILQRGRWPETADTWLEIFLETRRRHLGHQN